MTGGRGTRRLRCGDGVVVDRFLRVQFMDGGDLASTVSAGVAVVAMIGSGVGWFLARKEKKAAADQADRATTAAESAAGHAGRAADAAERSATAAESQERREAEAVDAADQDPWVLAPIPGDDDVYLVNRSTTPKYSVTVSGFKVHDSPAQFDMIGGGKRVEVSILRIMHPDDGVEVTRHSRKDLSDESTTRTETIPSRI
jgi:hypothetical protein